MKLEHDPAAKLIARSRKLHRACVKAIRACQRLIKLLEAEKRKQ